MKTARFHGLARLGALLTLGLTTLGGASQAQVVSGNWTLDDTLNGAIGLPLEFITEEGYTWDYQNDTINGQTARVLRFDRMNGADKIRVYHNIAPNGGGGYVNNYSIVLDVWFPAEHDWIALHSTNYDTYNDADWYIRGDNGIGISGDYTDFFNPLLYTGGEWHRLSLSIASASPTGLTDTQYRSYIDGKLQNIVQFPGSWGLDGRFSLYSTLDTVPWFLLFSEPTGLYTSEGKLNNLQVRDYAMTDSEIAQLGGPTASAIDTQILPQASVSGTLTFEDIVPEAQPQLVFFEFRPDDGTTSFIRPVTVAADGSYTLTGLLRKNYTLRIKGLKYLATLTTADTREGDISGVSVVLKGGDSNGDNSADALDLADLITAFNTTNGIDADYNELADFNGDGSDDALDLAILITNFNTEGAP